MRGGRFVVVIAWPISVACTVRGWGNCYNGGKAAVVRGRRSLEWQSKSSNNIMAFGRSGQSSPALAAEKGEVEASAATASDGQATVELVAREGASSTLTSAVPAEPGFVNGILNTARDFLVDAKTGTVALWTNFQLCQDIRKRVKGGHLLTYAEHVHLERGANDRRKLLQFVIIYAISPETFPYIVLYAPSLLPSTYEKPHGVRARYKRLAHERVAATLTGFSKLERQIIDADAKLKGKERKPGTRQTRRIEELEAQRTEALEILQADSKKRAFELWQERLVVPAPPPPVEDEQGKRKKQPKHKLPKACGGLPNPAAKALGKGMGLAGWRGVAPVFYIRWRLNEHVKDLGKGDEILRRQPLSSLSEDLLREACNARGIDVVDSAKSADPQALRKSLAEWLELTSADGVASRKAGPEKIFLPDRARLIGLGLNFLDGVREARCAELPRRALLNSW